MGDDGVRTQVVERDQRGEVAVVAHPWAAARRYPSAATLSTPHAMLRPMPTPEIATIYLDAHDRIDALVRSLEDDAVEAPVAACPDWSVGDVVRHLAGSVAWAADGRLQGMPTSDDTAAQVAELAALPVPVVLDRWALGAPGFAELVAAADIWPGAIDVVTHEHDIRHAVSRPGARDVDAVRRLADQLLRSWSPSRPVDVVRRDRTVRVGPGQGDALRWATDDFEVLRSRLGRRSRAQLAALGWSDDPGAVVDEVAVFPPAAVDIVE